MTEEQNGPQPQFVPRAFAVHVDSPMQTQN